MIWVLLAILLCVLLFGLYFRVCCFPVMQRPRKNKIRIACIGDSITFGAGVQRTRWRDAWPFILNRLLGCNYQVMNFGHSGATLQDEGDLPYRPLGYLEKIQEARPAYILLMLGTNDSKPYNWNEARYRAEYDQLVKELISYPGKPQVILLAPPKAFPQEATGQVAFDINNELISNAIHTAVLSVAAAYSLPVIDLYALTQTHPEYFMDGVHPNRLGNVEIAKAVACNLS